MNLQFTIEEAFSTANGCAGSGWHKYKYDDPSIPHAGGTHFMLEGSIPPDTESSLFFFKRRLEALIAYKTCVAEGVEAGLFCTHEVVTEEGEDYLAVSEYGVVVNIPLGDPRFSGDPIPSWWLDQGEAS